MMEQQNRPQGRSINLPIIAVAVAIAAALGFGVARLIGATTVSPAPSSAATSAAVADEDAKPEARAFAEIKIPAEYLKAAQIAVEAVSDGGMSVEITGAGTVIAAPEGEAVILSRASGNVTSIHRQLGDSVKAGDTLAQVDSLDAATMSADRNATAARAQLARKTYVREKNLFDQGVTPRQDVETAQAALAVAEADTLRASAIARAARLSKDGNSIAVLSPIAGKVTSQSVTLGGFVQPQTELFRVAGNGRPRVEAAVAAADISRVATGDRATIIPSSGTPVLATVRSITPTVSGATRAATVLLTPVPATSSLVVGEGVKIRLQLKSGGDGMIVPEDAVQNIEGRDVLFVRTESGFLPTSVLVGTRSGGMAQIVSGVKVGAQIATRNAFLIKADMIKVDKE